MSQVPTHKDPSTGINQAIVHRLYLKVCELYLNNNPRFYTGPKLPKTEPQVVYPVPLASPDYLARSQSVKPLRIFKEQLLTHQTSGNTPSRVLLFANCTPAKLFLLALENFVTKLPIISKNLKVTIINCRYSYKFRVLKHPTESVFLIDHGFANFP